MQIQKTEKLCSGTIQSLPGDFMPLLVNVPVQADVIALNGHIPDGETIATYMQTGTEMVLVMGQTSPL